MKGQMELLEILILVIGVSILIVISYFLFTAGIPSPSRMLIESHKYDRITDVVNEFYYSKISGTDRTLSQLVGDRISGKNSSVSYGTKLGGIDVDNQTIQFFDSYFGKDQWRLEIKPPETADGSSEEINLGYKIPKNIRVQTFEMLIPVPTAKNQIARGYLYVW